MACYPGEGARYVRHLDAFEGGTNRRLTCLYYMNKNWQPEHGGQLRLYLPDPSDPTGDRGNLRMALAFLKKQIVLTIL